MRTKTTTAITKVKREIRLRELEEQIRAQQESGMTVTKYCEATGISTKTYYYHLHKVREYFMESAPAIVPVTTQKSDTEICIEKNGLHITLSSDIPSETLLALIRELC